MIGIVLLLQFENASFTFPVCFCPTDVFTCLFLIYLFILKFRLVGLVPCFSVYHRDRSDSHYCSIWLHHGTSTCRAKLFHVFLFPFIFRNEMVLYPYYVLLIRSQWFVPQTLLWTIFCPGVFSSGPLSTLLWGVQVVIRGKFATYAY